jgi:soluble lytic murein transglycosylase-like protein
VPRHELESATKTRALNRRGARLAAIAVGATIALGGVGTALAADSPDRSGNDLAGTIRGSNEPTADVPVLDRESQLEQSLSIGIARQRYRTVYEQAERLGVEPKVNLASSAANQTALGDAKDELRKDIHKEQARRAAKPDFGTPESVGVDQSTLDAIAACESGGDPTAVDSSGTYRGKYQFDLGTWASVGGSGDPAAAPEAEQDYRAALLMSQAGSSPWPVCG